ncbi:RelA/SpoT family protein [Thermodesulfobacteriota bacterium]
MLRINDLLEDIKINNPDADLELIQKAYIFSAKVHKGQKRRSGEPYLIHPLTVADILAKMKLDESTIVVGLLHDVVEDTHAEHDEIAELFGDEVATLVDGVTKISKIESRDLEDRQAENFRKMIIAMAKDVRVILVKLADRLHNMRTLQHMKEESQRRIAQETMDIYSPLANRLGISWIKSELEDLSFMYTQPILYKQISSRFKKTKNERDEYIKTVRNSLEEKLKSYNINAEVTGRAKHFYSVYQKMQRRGLSFDQLHDIIAFRVMVDEVKDCYEALGIVHSMWKPVPGYVKDYIGLPKPNMYQSLHTVMIGPFGERVEVQIRTKEMHKIAEDGVAAHWRYKESGTSRHPGKSHKKFDWVDSILEWQKDTKSSREFMDDIKDDLTPNKMIYVFTPNGDVNELPDGSCPIDFAYSIHSQIGDRCVGAKINNKIVPLKHKLKNGDTAEIVTSASQKPNASWLNLVKTSKARTRIRHCLKVADFERSLLFGKELCNKEFRKFTLTLPKLTKSGKLLEIAKGYNFKSEDALLAAIGFGKVTPLQIISKILSQVEIEKVYKKKESKLTKVISKITRGGRSAVKVSGLDDILIRFAKCCSPVSGEPILGYISHGRGITIHTTDCHFAKAISEDRQISVKWDVKDATYTTAIISVKCDNKKGILADIAACISKLEANISDVKVDIHQGDAANCIFKIEVKNISQLKKIMKNIEKLKGVISVERRRK